MPSLVWKWPCALFSAVRTVHKWGPLCVPAVFQVWRGIGPGSGWSQGWTRCLRWDSDGRKAEVRIFNYPVWLVRCRGGRARLVEVYQKGRGAIRLPTDMLSIRLPRLLDIHQVPKVRLMLRSIHQARVLPPAAGFPLGKANTRHFAFY